MKVSGDWLTNAATQAVCRSLTDAGYQALVVGGCVRNALLGVAVSDVDIATDAHPETVSNLAENAGFKAIPTGLDHGTITVVAKGIPHEITTFRHDVETDGRHARVAFSTEISDDARRRDFTMNALYAAPDGTVIDPLGGLADLKARRVRFIEDPHQRLAEDYLRALRFFRFHAWYGDESEGLDADALAAIADSLDGLKGLSKERITSEILKLLSAPNPTPAVAAMEQTGVLGTILGAGSARALGPLVHVQGVLNLEPDALTRLSALGVPEVQNHLRLSKAQVRRVVVLQTEASLMTPVHDLAYHHDADLAMNVACLRAAMLEMPLPDDVAQDAILGARAVFPVTAADLMPGLKGADLGAKLKQLETRWIASRFTLSKEDLLRG